MLNAYTSIPLDVAARSLEMMEQASRQLARTGGMLNRDLAGEVTRAASALRHSIEQPEAVNAK